MSFTVTTDKDAEGQHYRIVTPAVFDQIAELGGFGIRASSADFDAHTSCLAVNKDTQNFSEISKLLGPAKTEKEGAK